MERIKNFIDENGLENGWRGYRLENFIVWVPFGLLSNFVSKTEILKSTQYGVFRNCGLCDNVVAIDLTEIFYLDNIEAVFPRVD